MKKFLVLLLLCSGFFILSSYAQDNRDWGLYYNFWRIVNNPQPDRHEYGRAVATDSEGYVYMVGNTAQTYNGWPNGSYEVTQKAFIVKFNPNQTQFFGENIIWEAYFGGSDGDVAYSITIDSYDNIYVAGKTYSDTGFGLGGFLNNNAGGHDAFLVKFDSDGNRIWATYYGGTNEDAAYSVATDSTGNVYLSGYTKSDSLISSGGFQNSLGGSKDAFLVKFDSSGNRLWATYYGGSEDDIGNGIACDNAGNVFFTGETQSLSGIADAGFQNNMGGGTSDAFLVKFDADGNRIWSTYYGGTNTDLAKSVTVDNSGNVYITGSTSSSTNISSNGFQNSYGGGFWDAFLAKFNTTGNRIWATYYGNTGNDDEGLDVAADLSGNIFMSGTTTSFYGIAAGGFDNTFSYYSPSGTNKDAFLVKFNSEGTRLCATYYGGTEDEDGYIVTDNSGHIYMGGTTNSSAGIMTSLSCEYPYGGGRDAYLVKFNSSTNSFGAYESFTNSLCYLQCSGSGYAIPVGGVPPYSYLWSDGQTTDTAIGLCETTSYTSYTVIITDSVGATAAATVRIEEPYQLFANISSTVETCGLNNGTVSVYGYYGTPPYSYLWNDSLATTNDTVNGLSSGIYSVEITDNNGCQIIASDTVEDNNLVYNLLVTDENCSNYNNGYATISVMGGTSPYSYSWSNGATTQDIYNLAPGNYTAIVTDADGCIITDSVVVQQGFDFSATIAQNGDTLASSPAPNYQWYLNDTILLGATSQEYLLTEGGYYYVTTTVNGCTDTSNVIETSCLCVGISENEFAKGIFIYPNPAGNNITIEIRQPKGLYEVYDNTSKLLTTGIIKTTKFTIDLRNYCSGIYLLRIIEGDKQAHYKIIKE